MLVGAGKEKKFCLGRKLLEKNFNTSVLLLFSWGWMVDKLARSINFERNGVHHTNGTFYSLISKLLPSNIVLTKMGTEKLFFTIETTFLSTFSPNLSDVFVSR